MGKLCLGSEVMKADLEHEECPGNFVVSSVARRVNADTWRGRGTTVGARVVICIATRLSQIRWGKQYQT